MHILRKIWNYVPVAIMVSAAMIIAVFIVVDKPVAPMTLSEAQGICRGAAYETQHEESSGTVVQFRCYDGRLASRR